MNKINCKASNIFCNTKSEHSPSHLISYCAIKITVQYGLVICQ